MKLTERQERADPQLAMLKAALSAYTWQPRYWLAGWGTAYALIDTEKATHRRLLTYLAVRVLDCCGARFDVYVKPAPLEAPFPRNVSATLRPLSEAEGQAIREGLQCRAALEPVA